MTDIQKMKYGFAMCYAAVRVSGDITTGKLSKDDIVKIARNLMDYAHECVPSMSTAGITNDDFESLLERL